MSQILSQTLGQHMRLEQRLTPQLIQSMDILQLNIAALEHRIAEELERNVALESADVELPEVPDISSETPEPPPATKEHHDAADTESRSFNRLERLDREYDLDLGEWKLPSHRPTRFDGERDAKMDAMANTAARPQSLAEHLLEQWALLDLDPDTRRGGEVIIYSLDEDGYLRMRLDEVADNTRPPIEVSVLQAALPQVQRLDPVGVAARDYQESLLIQLEALPGNNGIERELIENHLHDVVRNRYPAIAKATGYSVGEITEAVKVISTCLHLHPAFLVIDRRVPRIRPDVIVEYDDEGDDLVIRLTRGNMPSLRISTRYSKMLKEKGNDRKTRSFVRQHLESATALIDAINYRRNRLFDVAKAVVEQQRDFFSQGPSGLKVLRMSELAIEQGCDPSTISRTVADKYLQSPRGIYPLRYFFTGGTESDSGESTSWDSVKARVQELIKGEDRKNPFNDDQIADALKEEGITLSRRTVAKYRQQLDIPTARQRRVF